MALPFMCSYLICCEKTEALKYQYFTSVRNFLAALSHHDINGVFGRGGEEQEIMVTASDLHYKMPRSETRSLQAGVESKTDYG
jgi:hypothetical protein